jgi:hypothetical protein
MWWISVKFVPWLLTDKQTTWQSLVAKSTAVDHHPPYPPDLAHYDFFLFPRKKLQL